MDVPVQIVLQLVNKLTGPAREASRSMIGIASQTRELTRQTERAAASARQTRTAIDGIGAGTVKVTRGTAGIIGKLAIFKAAAAAAAVPFVRTGMQFEGFAVQIQKALGPERAKAAADAMMDLAQWSTKFGVQDFMNAFLEGTKKGIVVNTKQLKIMADTAAATGMNVAEVSHMIGQGAVDAARALREFNILVDQNAKKGTATFKWIDDAGKWQQVTVKAKEQAKVVSTLLDLLDKKFGGTEMRLGKTMAGLLDNIGDIVEMFRKRVGDAGLYQYVKTQFGGFIDWINAKVADGSLDKWARAASDSIIGILEAGRGFALAAPGMAKAIADMVGPLKELEPATLMKLGAALYFLPDGIMIGAGLTQIAGGLTSMIAALQASRNMGVNLLRIATGIAAIGAALYTMDCYRDTFRNFIDSLQPNGGQPIVDLSCCRFHGH